ncbi:MAG: dynamin family protein [Burkholderiales bacterium]|nr:dynamin family protein [Burkholderiales bacterium]MBZ0249174.1 dynamin family protein [Burkholderiales bacterium]
MTPATPVDARFEGEIARYNRWREDLTRSVTAYHDWLESNGQLDVQQSIRFYDLLENLNKGRLMLAFLAEFSRGKSELINALFFSSFKERLLPSDVGRTTMCPTEIFHDPSEEPYLKLLSVETRYRDESITQLKNNPVEWSKVRLNTGSAAEMKKALAALADTKKVYALEARMLGLAPMVNENGELPGEEELVEVPAWRYAMINYPHPLLSNGLSILDTPGLNALGMEPELTVSTLPGAHAILFLLSIDTGVTKSDLEIWDRYVKPGLPQKIAVLNKIDLMWDELKTPQEIDRAVQRMVETTAKALTLDAARIFPLSAQKALLGKIREDAGLVRKSGIEALEKYLAQEIVPMRRQILCKAVMNEIGAMMVSSRTAVANKQQANQAAMAELQGLVGKSREVVTKLWQKIATEKAAYNAALAEYKVNHANFSAKRAALMDMLNSAKMDAMLAQSAQAMEDSWTTVGLQRAMRELSRLMSADFERVFAASEDIKKLMQGVYNTFVEKFGFQRMTLPSLDLELHATKLKLLVAETEEFSRDPINVANYKSFFVKKFHASLVAQARTLFSDARAQSERWVQAVTLPLEIQMKDHKQQLQSRLDNLSKINEKSTGINEQLAELKAVGEGLRKQREMIDGLLQRVSREEAVAAAAPAPGPAEATAPMMPPELMETTKLSVFEAPLTITRRAARAQEVFREVAHVKEEAPKPVAPKPAAPAKPAAAPMISDDMLAALARRDADSTLNERAAAADTTINQRGSDGEKTQRLPAFDPRLYNPDGSRKSAEPGAQPPGADRTQKMNPGDTQKLDFTSTQKLDPGQTQKLAPEATQKLDLSIEKLKEARRLLQATQKT